MSKSNFANIIFLSVLSVTLFLVSCSTEEDEKLPPMSSSSGAHAVPQQRHVVVQMI